MLSIDDVSKISALRHGDLPEDVIKYEGDQDRSELVQRMKTGHRMNLKRNVRTTAPYVIDGTTVPPFMHLREEAEVRSIFVRNYGTGAASFYSSPNGNGSLLGQVANGKWECFPVQDGLTNVYVVMSNGATGSVIVLISSEKWDPSCGSL